MNGITCALTGRLGGDAELKYTAGGLALVAFSVAVDDTKRPEGEDTEWVRAVLFGEAAEDLAPRLVKGTSVYVEGRVRLEVWQHRDGGQRSTLKLTAWTVQPLGQIGRRRPARRGPRGEPIQLGSGSVGRGGRVRAFG